MSGRTLMGVWAHPDDEAYLSAGLMLEHVERGDRVVVVTATLGEHGTADPRRWPPTRLAARRHDELQRSLAALGVHELHVLGFGDGDCHRHDGTDLVARHLDEIRPDVIVTFGPDGMTGHPDHRAVSRWTTDAWRAAGAPGELWYATVTADFHERWGHVNEQIGLWSDQPAPPCASPDDLCHAIALSARQLDTKYRALRAHRSQTAAIVNELGRRTFRRWWASETFCAASSPASTSSRYRPTEHGEAR
jgi:LmbE family N-acetylglucosaminyl deacetylase